MLACENRHVENVHNLWDVPEMCFWCFEDKLWIFEDSFVMHLMNFIFLGEFVYLVTKYNHF